MLEKIISGGQRGADQAGLHAAKALGLATGGIAPKGWKVRLADGSDVSDPVLATFGMTEHHTTSYSDRTKLNVEQSDGTVWFGYAQSPGGKLTLKYCKLLKKPWLINPTSDELALWVTQKNIKVLNIAGNRESSFNPDIFNTTYQTIVRAFASTTGK